MNSRVAAEEFKLSYHNSETRMFTIYLYYVELNKSSSLTATQTTVHEQGLRRALLGRSCVKGALWKLGSLGEP